MHVSAHSASFVRPCAPKANGRQRRVEDEKPQKRSTRRSLVGCPTTGNMKGLNHCSDVRMNPSSSSDGHPTMDCFNPSTRWRRGAPCDSQPFHAAQMKLGCPLAVEIPPYATHSSYPEPLRSRNFRMWMLYSAVGTLRPAVGTVRPAVGTLMFDETNIYQPVRSRPQPTPHHTSLFTNGWNRVEFHIALRTRRSFNHLPFKPWSKSHRRG